jgi:hypothetical protein
MPGSPVPVPLLRRGLCWREPGQGEHGQGDVGVPGTPGADLVVVQPGLALGLLEALLDVPAAARDRGQAGGAGAAGPVAGNGQETPGWTLAWCSPLGMARRSSCVTSAVALTAASSRPVSLRSRFMAPGRPAGRCWPLSIHIPCGYADPAAQQDRRHDGDLHRGCAAATRDALRKLGGWLDS